ncbi:hypothetical protein BCR44DRAFT_35437 [Catenaria anguillulae PL171]|uniref:Rho GTPase activation protein n=1 Tax=Catenaria anguillulae PL171 TaxID=765915 RepID=A0A1Y2HMH3_9FUNG|nr:hypothetical protein BCR44DRAFT_35437 [Catenaria anguillulae PL171]
MAHYAHPPPTTTSDLLSTNPGAAASAGAVSHWVPIRDPESGDTFYANPDTGECTWDLLPGMLVMDGGGHEIWWQLFDERTSTPYYYSTASAQTQWPRPTTGLVVNLINIQKHAIGKRVSLAYQPAGQYTFDALAAQDQHRATSGLAAARGGAAGINLSPITIPGSTAVDTGAAEKRYSKQLTSASSGGYDVVETPMDEHEYDGHGVSALSSSAPPQHAQQASANGRNHMHDGPRSAAPHMTTFDSTDTGTAAGRPLQKSASASDLAKSAGVSNPINNPAAARAMHPLLGGARSDNVLGGSGVKGAGAGGAGVLPPDLRSELERFQIDGFAKKFFREHKRGIFRRRVPVEKLLVWSKESLKLPLMVISKARHKDALKCFKIIQRIMGDRSSGGLTSTMVRNYKPALDIQWILERGVMHGEMRDEIYVQVCKQLTSNPSGDSLKRGWELMACLTPTFPPSKNFEEYLKTFVAGAAQGNGAAAASTGGEARDKVAVIAAHCLNKLERSCRNGPRGKTPTVPEVERMVEAPFAPSVFGETLEDIMRIQQREYPHLAYPRILVFLSQSVLDLNGCSTEGIFRVPGDADAITDLRLRIEKNRYDVQGIADANVPAGLLKFWLRELAEPLIPSNMYQACISTADDVHQAMAMIEQLPEVNKRVAKYMIAFLQIVSRPEHQKATKMSVQNLAMVFAPNFLRCPSDNPTQIFENTKYEQQFLRHLITEARYDIEVRAVPWQ